MRNVDASFQELVGNRDAKLREFQEEVIRQLDAGENVIVKVPTGAGKTWAALISFLHSLLVHQRNSDGVIYAAPLRTLVSGLYASTYEACQRAFQVTDRCELLPPGDNEISVSIQMGGQAQNPFLTADIVFTTIDQLLYGYLTRPLSLSDSAYNINQAAPYGKLVVVDEVHLLDPRGSLITLIEMAQRLKGVAQFLLMTATLSDVALTAIAKAIGAKIVAVDRSEVRNLPSHRDKKRAYVWVNNPLTAEAVVKHHSNRSLVVCNTVKRAQEIYRGVRNLMNERDSNCRVELLTNRFFPSDRKKKEEFVYQYFGPSATGSNAILISTQIVEAGLDISADVLHTELCPANSLVQRAGRCARYPEPRNIGTVLVYELSTNENGNLLTEPYKDLEKYWGLLTRTRAYLKLHSGENFDFAREEQMVNDVHGECDAELARNLPNQLREQSGKVEFLWRQFGASGNSETIREMVRDIDSVSVLLTAEPEKVELDRRPQLLSVSRGVLKGLARLHDVPDCPIKYLKFNDSETYDWVPISCKEVSKASNVIALPPWAAGYSQELGLEVGVEGERVEVVYSDSVHQQPKWEYVTETWLVHALNTVTIGEFQEKWFTRARQRLARVLGLSEEIILKLEQLTLALHDVGKLASESQGKYRLWLQDFYPDDLQCVGSEALAHTRVASWEEAERVRKYPYKPPSHAAEGALAAFDIITEEVHKMLVDDRTAMRCRAAILLAMATHHGSSLSKVQILAFPEQALGYLGELGLTSLVCWNQRTSRTEAEKLRDNLLDGMERQGWLLYFYLVRKLRLADRAATALSDGKLISTHESEHTEAWSVMRNL